MRRGLVIKKKKKGNEQRSQPQRGFTTCDYKSKLSVLLPLEVQGKKYSLQGSQRTFYAHFLLNASQYQHINSITLLFLSLSFIKGLPEIELSQETAIHPLTIHLFLHFREL